MKQNYYYIISSLPELNLTDNALPFSINDLKDDLQGSLDAEDHDLLKYLFYPRDNKNLLRLLTGRQTEFEEGGNYSLEELDFGISVTDSLPPYMQQFIEEFAPRTANLSEKKLEKELLDSFINWQAELPNDFLREWLLYDSSISNLLSGLNCTKYERDFNEEIIGDHFIAENIRTTRSNDFGLSKVIPYVVDILGIFESKDPLEREREISRMKWNKLEFLSQEYYFTIESLLAYVSKMQLIHRNYITNDEKGAIRLGNLLDEVIKGNEVPDDFALKR